MLMNMVSCIYQLPGISRWKDMDQINGCGHRAAEKYDDVIYGITTGVKLEDLNA